MRRALVVGASGTLGREIVHALKARGCSVRGASRHPDRVPPEADEAVRAHLLDPGSLRAACAEMDLVVHAAGASLALRLGFDRAGFRGVDAVGTRNVVAAAQEAGVQTLAYVSVFSTPTLADTPYVAAHREAADAVRASGLAYRILQPTGFFSAFEALLPFARLGVMPLVGDGAARTNPIHPADLAAVLVEALGDDASEVPVGGPEVLTRREAGELAFRAVGKTPRFVSTPRAVLGVNAAVAGLVDRRMGELLRFLGAVSASDVLAPANGTRRLGPYLEATAARRG